MKHLKYINEIQDWASSNRLGGEYSFKGDIELFIKEYPVVTKGGSMGVDEFYEQVIQLAARCQLSKADVEKILQNKEIHLSEYLRIGLEKYLNKYGIR